MRKQLISLLAAAAIAAAPMFPTPAYADGAPALIRDAEIETTIRAYATPIFVAAGLDPQAIRVYLLQSDEVNAFVAGGMNLFIFTGLLVRTERPNQLVGVIAHETGHIAGGHLARVQDALRSATIQMILASVLGAAAGLAARNGSVAGAGILGGQSAAQASLLQYSRTMEASADAAALTFLDRTHQSARGLLEFFGILKKQEQILFGQPNPYLLNHPLTSDRIANVQEHVDHSPYSNEPDPPAWIEAHKRMVAKLIGYLWPLDRVLQTYPMSDNSLYARYARSIAFYRIGQLRQALPPIDSLIAEHPDDPYFQEQKGQILYESGQGAQALPFYEKAVALAPDQPLIRMELAQVQIEQNDPRLVKPAIEGMTKVVQAEPRNPDAWRLLGIAYGRDGQMGEAALALAESAADAGRMEDAHRQAEAALAQLPQGSPGWLRAQDILTTSKPTPD